MDETTIKNTDWMPLLDAGQVAERLGLARSTVYLLVAHGVLPHVRIGRSVRVPEDALRRWVAEHTRVGA